jgi:hypothetical protein
MKEMAQETLEMVTGAVAVDTMVRKRKPPLSEKAGCVQNPVTRGAGTLRTRS